MGLLPVVRDPRAVIVDRPGMGSRYLCPMYTRRWLLIAVVLLLVFVPAEAVAQGCAMCKAVAGSEPVKDAYGGSQSVGAGLNTGILFMMAVPYVLLFVFFRKKIVGFVREFRDAQG